MPAEFAGFHALGATVRIVLTFRDASDTPTNTAALPTYRVYGPSNIMANGTGTMSFFETGTITNATNASPIVITSANHGLTTGTRVTITGVTGNTAANTTAVITRIDANTFSIAVAGNGAYLGGGTWNTTGVYKADISAITGDGYASGSIYNVFGNGVVSVSKMPSSSFIVV